MGHNLTNCKAQLTYVNQGTVWPIYTDICLAHQSSCEVQDPDLLGCDAVSLGCHLLELDPSWLRALLI